MCGVSIQWPSTQITLFERTRQSAWLDAMRHRWQEASEFLCTKTPLFGGSWATKKMAKNPRKCFLRRATNVAFSKFRGWRCKKKIASLNEWMNSWLKNLTTCFIHWLPPPLSPLSAASQPPFRHPALFPSSVFLTRSLWRCFLVSRSFSASPFAFVAWTPSSKDAAAACSSSCRKQVLIGKLLLPKDVSDVMDKHARISLKLLHTSLLVNFIAEHAVLTRCLYKAADALRHDARSWGTDWDTPVVSVFGSLSVCIAGIGGSGVAHRISTDLLLRWGFRRRWGWSGVYHIGANRTRQRLGRGLSLLSVLWRCLLLSSSVLDRVLGPGNQILWLREKGCIWLLYLLNCQVFSHRRNVVAPISCRGMMTAGGMGQSICFGLPFSMVSYGRSSAGLFRGMPWSSTCRRWFAFWLFHSTSGTRGSFSAALVHLWISDTNHPRTGFLWSIRCCRCVR